MPFLYATRQQMLLRMSPRLCSVLLASTVGLLACEPKKKTNNPDDPPPVEQPTLNLFGFEEAYIHFLHFNVKERRRLILVEYHPEQSDEIKILDCPITTEYVFQNADGHIETLHIRTLAELQARIPMGVARFGAVLDGGRELAFRYATVGSYLVNQDPQIPADDPTCAKATHYVASLSVGAFELAESKGGSAGVEAGTAAGPGVKTGASHESSSTSQWGRLEACGTGDNTGCMTPTQMLLWPVRSAVAVEPPPPPPSSAPATALPTIDQSAVTLTVDEQTWRPGHYMARALSRMLAFAHYIDSTTMFGFDDRGSAILGGFLTDDGLRVGRNLEGGRDYMIFAASSLEHDIDIGLMDESGQMVAVDNLEDAEPLITFTPPADGNYTVVVAPGATGQPGTFAAVGILRMNGFRIPPDLLQSTFQQVLDKGMLANQMVAQNEGVSGLSFHDANAEWSLMGTILKPGEQNTMSGFHFSEPAVIISAGHDPSLDLNAVMEDGAGHRWADEEPDGTPILQVVPQAPSSGHTLTLSYARGDAPTLGVSLVTVAR